MTSALLQAELAQEEAEQLQGAGHFAEAAALSSSAHKWRKKAAKVFEFQHCMHREQPFAHSPFFSSESSFVCRPLLNPYSQLDAQA